ncbi:hypothetical protein OG418_01295 [Streptomyces phaeochromogenes]|uniref:hypothetical protein n=1 Tax=Streptomyces phaeochromogenes TaxID=1923 RepID=UPI003254B5CE
MLVVTREGDRRCKLRPSQRAMVALVPARTHHPGGGPWVTTGIKRRPLQELTLTEKTLNRARARAAARAPVERGVARLNPWRIFHKARRSPNRMT